MAIVSVKCTLPNISKVFFYVPLTLRLGIIFVNSQLDAQFSFVFVYCDSLHVSDTYVSIIRRINCINATSVICHSNHLICIPDGQSDI